MSLSLIDALTSATDTPLGLAAAIVVPVVGAGIWSIKLVVSKLLERADKDRDFMLTQIEHERESLKETISTLQSFVANVSAESNRRMQIIEDVAAKQVDIMRKQEELRQEVARSSCRAK